MDPSKLVDDLNELLRVDETAVNRLFKMRLAAGDLGGVRGMTHLLYSDKASTIGVADVLNVVLAQSAQMLLVVREFPTTDIAEFRIVDRDPWFADPRPPIAILTDIPASPENYRLVAPRVGDRVLLPLIHAEHVRHCFPDAFIAICDQQTREGVMLSREADFAFIRFGGASAAVVLEITMLLTHNEDAARHDQSPPQVDQEPARPASSEVQPEQAG